MKEGYEIPSDLQYVSKPWWGLSTIHFVIVVVGVLLSIGWYKLIGDFNSPVFRTGMSIIIIAVVITILL